MRNATARAVSAEVTVISEDAAARPLGARTTPRPSTPARTSSTATEDLLVGIRDRESRHQPQHNGTTLRQPQLPPTGLPRCPLQLHLQRSHEGDGGTSITTASATGSTCILIGYLLHRSYTGKRTVLRGGGVDSGHSATGGRAVGFLPHAGGASPPVARKGAQPWLRATVVRPASE